MVKIELKEDTTLALIISIEYLPLDRLTKV